MSESSLRVVGAEAGRAAQHSLVDFGQCFTFLFSITYDKKPSTMRYIALHRDS